MANSAFFVEALTLGQSESSHHISYFRISDVNIQSLRTWFIRLSSVINMLKRSLSISSSTADLGWNALTAKGLINGCLGVCHMSSSCAWNCF